MMRTHMTLRSIKTDDVLLYDPKQNIHRGSHIERACYQAQQELFPVQVLGKVQHTKTVDIGCGLSRAETETRVKVRLYNINPDHKNARDLTKVEDHEEVVISHKHLVCSWNAAVDNWERIHKDRVLHTQRQAYYREMQDFVARQILDNSEVMDEAHISMRREKAWKPDNYKCSLEDQYGSEFRITVSLRLPMTPRQIRSEAEYLNKRNRWSDEAQWHMFCLECKRQFGIEIPAFDREKDYAKIGEVV